MFLHDVEGERGEALEVLRLAVHVVEAEQRVRAHESVQAGARGSRDDRQMTHLDAITSANLHFICVSVCVARNQCCGSLNISFESRSESAEVPVLRIRDVYVKKIPDPNPHLKI